MCVEAAEYDNIISIHASLAGGDIYDMFDRSRHVLFQSTPPLREATPVGTEASPGLALFQSTPPLREATERFFKEGLRYRLFQSTPPLREATYCRRRSAR